jgi:hypothetical protein
MASHVPLYTQWSYAVRTNNGSLRNWKRLNNRITFSCPICGDSHTDKKKARGNIYEYKGSLLYGCYNCGIALSFEAFLKQTNEPMYKEYKIENLTNKKKQQFYPTESKAEKILKNQLRDNEWKSVFVKCPSDAQKYLDSRKIPNNVGILYTHDFKRSMIDLYEMYGLDVDEMSPCRHDAKIIFPFIYDNVLTYVQGRSIDPNVEKAYRYMTMEVNGGHKVYGMERLKKDGDVFVTEGPIDSLFVNNGISVADANLTRANQFINKERLVLCYDNEPRSKVAIEKMEYALESGHRIVILPHYIEEKDLNEMYLNGRDVQRLVEQYQFSGPAGIMRLNQWKR